MLTVSYCEIGVDCDYVAKGETEEEEEIMKNAGEYAVKDHGYKQKDIMNPEMKEKNKFDNIFACLDFNKN
jgi:predicted small metal-binding protein